MDKTIYIASDGSGMTKDDLISWLSIFKDLNPHYENWSFDDITGGASEFFEIEGYVNMKTFYEKYMK